MTDGLSSQHLLAQNEKITKVELTSLESELHTGVSLSVLTFNLVTSRIIVHQSL